MSSGQFIRNTTVTFITGTISLIFNVGTSVILARTLGPDGRGIYTLAVLLSSLILTFGGLGIGPATVYYVARNEFRSQEVLGNNILLSAAISGVGIFAGLIVIIFLKELIFSGIPSKYLLLSLILVPPEILFTHLSSMLLGAQRIREFNYIQIIRSILSLGFMAFALVGLGTGVTGALFAGLFAWLVVNILTFRLVKMFAGGVDFKPNFLYIKQVITYGLQAHFANILGFLNYRVDTLLINSFLGTAAAGIYTTGMELAERLWMISYAASTVLFPRIAGEVDEKKRAEFTPLVARTTLWITAFAALVLFFLSDWVVLLLYPKSFSQAAAALRALLGGIVALSAGRVLANDLAGRGFPKFNVYTGLVAVTTNLISNLFWIPRFGIVGAAWASTFSYTVVFLGILLVYCRLSDTQWKKIIFLQRDDWRLYQQAASSLWHWVCSYLFSATF